MQEVIHDKWNIRFNELENNVELQPKESAADDDFKLMTERSHNSLIMHLQSSLQPIDRGGAYGESRCIVGEGIQPLDACYGGWLAKHGGELPCVSESDCTFAP